MTRALRVIGESVLALLTLVAIGVILWLAFWDEVDGVEPPRHQTVAAARPIQRMMSERGALGVDALREVCRRSTAGGSVHVIPHFGGFTRVDCYALATDRMGFSYQGDLVWTKLVFVGP